ncbi:hypothetical protein FGO68_gene17081 [Halteria grandinella]|uniref:Uncharacterized protein n=1 Tax=Halteria grandinella TaxID=5974 RepID=A0A8J8P364_HALGN|nr:hypothetical protein FGO68_gene17081 [Halteria grandinella]
MEEWLSLRQQSQAILLIGKEEALRVGTTIQQRIKLVISMSHIKQELASPITKESLPSNLSILKVMRGTLPIHWRLVLKRKAEAITNLHLILEKLRRMPLTIGPSRT